MSTDPTPIREPDERPPAERRRRLAARRRRAHDAGDRRLRREHAPSAPASWSTTSSGAGATPATSSPGAGRRRAPSSRAAGQEATGEVGRRLELLERAAGGARAAARRPGDGSARATEPTLTLKLRVRWRAAGSRSPGSRATGGPSSRAGSSAIPTIDYIAGIDTAPPPAGARAHRLHRGRHPQRRALAPAAGDRRSTRSSTAASSGTPSPGKPARALHEINVIGTLQLLAACERTESLRTVIVRGSAAIYGCEGAVPSFYTEDLARGRPLRTRFQRDISELERVLRQLRPPPSRAALLHAALPARDRPRPRQPAGALPDPAGGPGAARLRPAAAVPARRRRDRGDRGRGRQPGPRRRSTSRPSGSISLSRALRLLGRPARARCRRRCSRPLMERLNSQLGAGGLIGDGIRLLRFGRGVDNRRLVEEVGYEPRYDAAGAIARPRGRGGRAAGRSRPAPRRARRPARAARRDWRDERRERADATLAPEAIADFLREVRGGVEDGLDPLAAAREALGVAAGAAALGDRADRPPARGRLPRGRVGLRRGLRRGGLPAVRVPLRLLVAGGGRGRPATCPPTAGR